MYLDSIQVEELPNGQDGSFQETSLYAYKLYLASRYSLSRPSVVPRNLTCLQVRDPDGRTVSLSPRRLGERP